MARVPPGLRCTSRLVAGYASASDEALRFSTARKTGHAVSKLVPHSLSFANANFFERERGIKMTQHWQQLRRARLSRRSLLRASARAGVGAAGLALVGCGDDDDDSQQTATQAQPQDQPQQTQQAQQQSTPQQPQQAQQQQEDQADQQAMQQERQEQSAAEAEAEQQEQQAVADDNIDYNATAIGAYGAFPQILDQGSALARGGQSASNSYHYGAVFPLDPFGQAVPGGLAEWEFVGSESLTVTVNPGRTFHNGDAVTAADIKFTIDRLTGRADYNPEYNSAWTGELRWTGESTLIDDMTLSIAQADPSVDAANSLAVGGFPVFPKSYIEENGDEAYGQNPISTGAFKFVEWSPDERIVSVRNDDYFNGRDYAHAPRLAYLAGFEARLIPEIGARVSALEAGEVDLANSIPPDLAVPLGETGDYNVFYHPAQRGLHIKLPMTIEEDPYNPGQPNPWRDKRVRVAANLAVDVDAITQNIMTGRENYTYTLSSGQFGYPEELPEQRWGYDPEEARRLLVEAGYEDGVETDLIYLSGLYTNDQLFMEAIAEMLREVGFIVNLIPEDISKFLGEARNKELTAPYLFPQSAGFTSIGSMAISVGTEATYEHRAEVVSDERAEVDRLISEASTEFDTERRRELLSDLVRIHYLDAAWIFLFELVQTHVGASRLHWDPYFLQPPSVELWNLKSMKT